MPSISPLLARANTSEALTLTSLANHVPKVKAAAEAKKYLEEHSKTLSPQEKVNLRKIIREGSDSQETLVLMAIPLVKTIATKEYQRRRSWNSRVSYDDMVQEGIGGFLRGILSYNEHGKHNSATNYLGQWILSDIRRHVEALEHDFTIPHETIERHRKIRAIRSFLFNSLGRTPTDEEILAHANSGEYAANSTSKMGRVNKDNTSTPKQMTQKNLDEERSYYASTGALETLDGGTDEETYERTGTLITADNTAVQATTPDSVDEADARASLAKLFSLVFTEMRLGTMQEQIIRAKFGLPPYRDEMSLIDITAETRLTKYKINQVLAAFSQEMSTVGSAFHRIVASSDPDDLEAMGLTWVSNIVGEWGKRTQLHLPPTILTTTLRPVSTKARTHFGAPNRPIEGRFPATFTCPQHGNYTLRYLLSRSIPASNPCPQCGLDSPRTH